MITEQQIRSNFARILAEKLKIANPYTRGGKIGLREDFGISLSKNDITMKQYNRCVEEICREYDLRSKEEFYKKLEPEQIIDHILLATL